ncbi:MAG: glutamate-5-semialdehyde dehydrogenase [Thaumarchaeota archaeon]|jgi:glutamate-5-semialdehyde dehydrogenase|nr:glutamate-5-semialdehyde dehydrogenase [Nitrososphaerota archaeon]
MEEVVEKSRKAKEASLKLGVASTPVKNAALEKMAEHIERRMEEIIRENRKDVEAAESRGVPASLIDRLLLNEKRVREMAEGLRQVASLPDPIGEIVEGWRTRHGLEIRKIRVPLGVIGVIYEARPNVTVDITGLALKAGNAVVLRGGSEALNSNKTLVEIMRGAVKTLIDPEAIQLIEDPSRELVGLLLKQDKYIDVIIPRGSAQLIRFVRENSLIPVIETGAGNCHIFVNWDADLEMATRVIVNAKVQRPAVCNAVRKVLIHSKVAEKYLPRLVDTLRGYNVAIKGCRRSRMIVPTLVEATEEDWYEEYMDLTLAVKIVDSVEEAIQHINKYGSKHSDAIITNNLQDAELFTRLVDSSTVYVNASTRFTDGGQFGFGAEVGISTQKLHARGPMGLREITTTKYVVYGSGQIREL